MLWLNGIELGGSVIRRRKACVAEPDLEIETSARLIPHLRATPLTLSFILDNRFYQYIASRVGEPSPCPLDRTARDNPVYHVLGCRIRSTTVPT